MAIHGEGLVHRFGYKIAIDGVGRKVAPGEIDAVLGPNGAGETKKNRMLATLLRPDYGKARVFRHEVMHGANSVLGLMRGLVTAGQMRWVIPIYATLVVVFAPLTLHPYRNKK
jgi:ABC-type multidrug transport system ATPase subunit